MFFFVLLFSHINNKVAKSLENFLLNNTIHIHHKISRNTKDSSRIMFCDLGVLPKEIEQ